ncbi:MAG: hypothetical protein J6T35_07895, partial [Bacteroidales bacterium]|nr:hypothetical protein [Bacteroidales bacterium]
MKRMLLATLTVILWMGQSRAAEPELTFDENLVILISDLHINPEGYQPERCERIIHEILAMRPLPRNVLALGDIAYLCGKVEEYVRAGRKGNFQEALKIIKKRIPLPMSVGRVCPRFCEKDCRRNIDGRPVAINEVKRIAADLFYDS